MLLLQHLQWLSLFLLCHPGKLMNLQQLHPGLVTMKQTLIGYGIYGKDKSNRKRFLLEGNKMDGWISKVEI